MAPSSRRTGPSAYRLSVGNPLVRRGQRTQGDRTTPKPSSDDLANMESSADHQERAAFHLGRADLLLTAGDPTGALAAAERALAERETMGFSQEYTKQAFVTAVSAALELGDVDRAEELLSVVEALPPGRSTQFLQAHCERFRAHVSARQDRADEAERRFKRATGLFRELALRFYLGTTQLEFGEWLAAQDRATEAEPLLAEAREIFDRLEAKPWLERLADAGLPATVTS